MITGYSSEIKIAIFQSISACQSAEWRFIIKLWPSCGKNCTF